MPIDSNIRKLIQQSGYITVDQMMHYALAATTASYYRQQTSLGETGDFITAPEISQMFGEIIGIWCIEQWRRLGRPANIGIIELGPGSGLLMRDLLRSIQQLAPEFYNAVHVQLMEINQHFIGIQQKNLSKYDINIKWVTTLNEINASPVLIIANEFFDVLAIKQYIKIREDWHEVIVAMDPLDGKVKFDKIFIQKKELQAQLKQDHVNARDGAVIEESPESLALVRLISSHLKKYSGASLIIDYGYNIKLQHRNRTHYNSTLQAVKDHQYYPLLENLGEADISAHVDFNALRNTALLQGLEISEYTTQREFLMKYGIIQRAHKLRSTLVADEKQIIDKQVSRLIAESQMGNLFKVLTLFNRVKRTQILL